MRSSTIPPDSIIIQPIPIRPLPLNTIVTSEPPVLKRPSCSPLRDEHEFKEAYPQQPLSILSFFMPERWEEKGTADQPFQPPKLCANDFQEKNTAEYFIYRPDTAFERRIALTKFPLTPDDYYALAKKRFELLVFRQSVEPKKIDAAKRKEKKDELTFIIGLLFDAAICYQHRGARDALSNPSYMNPVITGSGITPYTVLGANPALLKLFKEARDSYFMQQGYERRQIKNGDKELFYWLREPAEDCETLRFYDGLTYDIAAEGSMGSYFLIDNHLEADEFYQTLFQQVELLQEQTREMFNELNAALKMFANKGDTQQTQQLSNRLTSLRPQLYFLPQQLVQNSENESVALCNLARVIEQKKHSTYMADFRFFTSNKFATKGCQPVKIMERRNLPALDTFFLPDPLGLPQRKAKENVQVNGKKILPVVMPKRGI